MASAMIHIAVANEINKKLKRDNTLLWGSIGPDISKLVGESKVKTHFLNDDTEIPRLDKFLALYGEHLNDSYVLGYYIHLYTDYLWFKYFLPEIYDENKNLIKKLDGSIIKCSGDMALKYIYNDYTNINSDLVKKYNLDLSFLYNEIPSMEHIIIEAHMDSLELLREANIKIIDNSKIRKELTFDIESISNFISLSVDLILSNLKELEMI